jgi:hypothetical protein
MRGEKYLDTANPDHRYAVFEIKNVEVAGALESGKAAPAKVTGILTIKGKSVQVTSDARVTYIKMAQGETGADHPTAAARIRRLGVHARDGRLRVRIGKRLKVVEESLRWPVHAERLRDPRHHRLHGPKSARAEQNRSRAYG